MELVDTATFWATADIFVFRPLIICAIAYWLLPYIKYQSAAMQSWAAFCACSCLLLLPVIAFTLPQSEIAIIPSTLASWVQTEPNTHHSASETSVWPTLITTSYLSVVFLLTAKLLTSIARLYWITKHSTPYSNASIQNWLTSQTKSLGIPRKINLKSMARVGTPMVWGVIKPTILLPINFDQLKEENQQQILLHELAHIQRNDWAYLIAGRITCIIFWHIPWSWKLHQKMRNMTERACDDLVINNGHTSFSYAETLVKMAGSLKNKQSALAMAQHSSLKARITAILDRFVDHEPLSFRYQVVILAIAFLLASPVTLVEATTIQNTFRKIPSYGHLFTIDKSPTPIEEKQKVLVPADFQPGSLKQSLISDQAFPDHTHAEQLLPKQPYNNVSDPTEDIAAQYLQQTISNLKKPIIQIQGQRPVKTVLPVYPERAQKKGIEGKVTVEYDISLDGSVSNARIIYSEPYGVFEQATLKAIRQFEFQPKMVNHIAVPVKGVTNTFLFRLSNESNHRKRRQSSTIQNLATSTHLHQ